MGLALTSQDIKNSTVFVPSGSGATWGQGPLGFFLQALDTAKRGGAGAARKQITSIIEPIIKFGNAARVFVRGQNNTGS